VQDGLLLIDAAAIMKGVRYIILLVDMEAICVYVFEKSLQIVTFTETGKLGFAGLEMGVNPKVTNLYRLLGVPIV